MSASKYYILTIIMKIFVILFVIFLLTYNPFNSKPLKHYSCLCIRRFNYWYGLRQMFQN